MRLFNHDFKHPIRNWWEKEAVCGITINYFIVIPIIIALALAIRYLPHWEQMLR